MALVKMKEAKSVIATTGDNLAGAMIDGSAARILALVGQHDLALEEIERLIDTSGNNLTRWKLSLDPRWDFFRVDQRFNDLVRPVSNP